MSDEDVPKITPEIAARLAEEGRVAAEVFRKRTAAMERIDTAETLRADLEQSRARHKMCQDSLASACTERDSLRSTLATSIALAAEQAQEIERLKGERDEAVRDRDKAREKRDCAQLAERSALAATEEFCRRPSLTHIRRDDFAGMKVKIAALTAERDELTDAIYNVPLADIVKLAAQRDERERIAAWLDSKGDALESESNSFAPAFKSIAAAIRSNAHNPEPGGD